MADSAVYRIMDANLNRGREALRVVEEYARFVLDDENAAGRVKHVRHGLREIASAIGSNELLAARDIANDVGRETKTSGEQRRERVDDVIRAAFARFGEASRSLGEYGKLISPRAAEIAEALRYQSYELEQAVGSRGEQRRRFRGVSLYVLLTESFCKHGWFETAEAVLRGGAGCLQLREKTFDDAELLNRAQRLRELTDSHDALLIVNDRPDIARLCGADGVHVGQEDLPVAHARRIAGGKMLIGKSTHTRAQFDAALAEAPDYLAVGPMFGSTTKPQDHIAGPETLRQAAERTDLPLVGIGGVTENNVGQVTGAGAACVCVCSAVIASDDPEAAASRMMKSIKETAG